MPPKKTLNTGQQVPKKDRKIKKEDTGLQAGRSPSLLPINYFPEPTAASQNLTEYLQHSGEKRENNFEDEPSDKRQKFLKSVPVSRKPLTKANLKEHNQLTNPGVGTSESGRQKTPTSKLPSFAFPDQKTSSVHTKVSSTDLHYRRFILRHAGIFVKGGVPPEEVQSRINAIIQCKISEERKCQLSGFAEDLHQSFAHFSDGAPREIDCVDPIRFVLCSMDSSRKFWFVRDGAWDQSLKPSFIKSKYDFSFLKKPNYRANDSQPRKQEEAETPYPFQDISPAAMLPPSPPLPKQEVFYINNPRPHLTVGFNDSTIVEELEAGGLDKRSASRLLNFLQKKHILCSNPDNRAPAARFPILVVEAKAYRAGSAVFEAQNQAAVSGSCMNKLQHELADLTKRASHQSYDSKAPLAFSICTEGPHMELWVHYTKLSENDRLYHMKILKTCHLFLLASVTEFLMVVDNIMSWAIKDVLKNIVKQLVLVANAMKANSTI